MFDVMPFPNQSSLRALSTCARRREAFSCISAAEDALTPFLEKEKIAPNLFDKIRYRNYPSLNSLLRAESRGGDADSAWLLFYRMHSTGCHLDGFTFTPILSVCAATNNLERGRQVHNLLSKTNTGSQSETVVGTTLMDMYSKCGQLGDAVQAFEELNATDIVTWNTLLSSFVQHGLLNKAVSVFHEMQRERIEISGFTLCSILKACASSSAVRQGKQVHASVIVGGRNSLFVSTALIDLYSNCDMIGRAIEVFIGLNCEKDDAICNSLLSGFVRNYKYDEAFSFLRTMEPNSTALTTSLVACSALSNLAYGKQLHCAAIRKGFECDTLLCNALLDMYAKCGKLSVARLIFDRSNEKNVVSWTSIIDAYGSHGHGFEALKLFEEMEEAPDSVSPNSVTFLAVLSACGHSGLLVKGQNCWVSMTEKHGIHPGPEHYACFIDLLGRAGKMEEAWDVFNDMVENDKEVTSAVWTALLNACGFNLDILRGEFAAKNLFESEPEKAENLVLLSNFYAAIGKWDAVEKLRRSITEKGLHKGRGSSWISHGC